MHLMFLQTPLGYPSSSPLFMHSMKVSFCRWRRIIALLLGRRGSRPSAGMMALASPPLPVHSRYFLFFLLYLTLCFLLRTYPIPAPFSSFDHLSVLSLLPKMASFPVSQSTQLTPEEALVHDFDHVSIHPEPQSQSHCLVVKILSPKTLKVDWIQKAMTEDWVHHIPFGSRSYGLAQFVADTIGDLIEVHLISLYDSITPFMRVRVLLDTTKSLHRGMNVHFRKLSLTKWLKFLYEGIQNYCYHCGKLDHTFNKCGKFLLHCDNHPYPPSLSYKDVLRAPAKSIYKKSIFEMSTSIPFEEQPSLANTGHPTIEDHNDHFTVPTMVEPTPPIATSPPPPAFTHTTLAPTSSIPTSTPSPITHCSVHCPIPVHTFITSTTNPSTTKGKAPMYPETSLPILSHPPLSSLRINDTPSAPPPTRKRTFARQNCQTWLWRWFAFVLEGRG
ncbi:hypothetical protein G4B88_017026 [Cannabis sativa]|uniref:CCHC-type domain-containing protein n=1 Tax=Cannabis sativa TaxID=3483 RepID=A0A7J6GYJ5_CANSA|nr:hypothetical protein G4B88_017026 [Cannabis sativa]